MLGIVNSVQESTPTVSNALEALEGAAGTATQAIITSIIFAVIVGAGLIILAVAQKKAGIGVVGALLGGGFAFLGVLVGNQVEVHAEEQLVTAMQDNVALHYTVEEVSVQSLDIANEPLTATIRMTDIEGTVASHDMTYDESLDMMVPVAISALNNMPIESETKETKIRNIESEQS